MFETDEGAKSRYLEMIGVHNGIEGVKTYGTVITKKILDDFILPTLEVYRERALKITEDEVKEH